MFYLCAEFEFEMCSFELTMYVHAKEGGMTVQQLAELSRSHSFLERKRALHFWIHAPHKPHVPVNIPSDQSDTIFIRFSVSFRAMTTSMLFRMRVRCHMIHFHYPLVGLLIASAPWCRPSSLQKLWECLQQLEYSLILLVFETRMAVCHPADFTRDFLYVCLICAKTMRPAKLQPRKLSSQNSVSRDQPQLR